MTRSRNRNKSKPKAKPTPAVAPAQQALNNKDLEGYGLELMKSFMKTDEDVIAIAYRIDTSNIAREDIVTKYKTSMISALQQKGREKGYTVPVDKIEFKALPLGKDCLIKAFAYLRFVTKSRTGEQVIEKANNDPLNWNVNVRT